MVVAARWGWGVASRRATWLGVSQPDSSAQALYANERASAVGGPAWARSPRVLLQQVWEVVLGSGVCG